MRISKKIISISLVLMISISIPIFGVKNVKATYASQIGFKIDESEYQFLKWMDIERLDTYIADGGNNYLIGSVMTKIGAYKLIDYADIPQGKDVYTYGYKTTVEPRDYTYKKRVLWWNTTVKGYGYAEELHMKIDLWQWTNYPYATRSDLTYCSPTTQPQSDSYKVGFNGGIKSDGSASIGFSTDYTRTYNRLAIRNTSSEVEDYFEVNYNYVPIKNTWENDDYLFDPSWQYGVFTIEVNQGITPYMWVNTTAKFGKSLTENSYGSYSPMINNTIPNPIASSRNSIFVY